MFPRPEQAGETRLRIEVRQAQPCERSALVDQRGRAKVANQGIVADL